VPAHLDDWTGVPIWAAMTIGMAVLLAVVMVWWYVADRRSGRAQP
jgi:hypothetical protein